MRVLPRTSRQNRIKQANCHDDEEPVSVPLTYEDVQAFLDVDTKDDHQEFMSKYSSPFQPLYGTKKVFRDEDRRGIAFSNEYETINDFLNLKSLLSVGLKLCALSEQMDIKPQDTDKLGIEVEKDAIFGDYYSLKIELEAEPETMKYLKKGLDNTMFSFPRCDLIRCRDADVASSRHILHVSTGLIKSTPNSLRKACTSLLDAMSTIMLHDLSVRVIRGMVYQVCESTASSLWYVLLEAFKEGRADFCKVCGKPFVSLDERKNKRLYCSGACNKMHQRLTSYNNYVAKGLSEEEAAKKAGVALIRAKAYWDSQHNSCRHQHLIG